jgi:hypothetical protein
MFLIIILISTRKCSEAVYLIENWFLFEKKNKKRYISLSVIISVNTSIDLFSLCKATVGSKYR